MDFLGSPEESTKVVRMKEELDSFLQRGRRHSQSKAIPIRSDSSQKSRRASKLLGTLDFDFSSITEDDGNESMEEKRRAVSHEKEVELLSAKSKIIRLESDLNNLQNDRKHIRLEHDRESTDFKVQIQRDQTDRDEILHKLRRATQTEESLQLELEAAKEEVKRLQDRLKGQQADYLKEKTKLMQSLEEKKVKAETEATDIKERLDRKCAEVMTVKLKLEESNAREDLLRRKLGNMVTAEEFSALKFELEKATHRTKEVEDKLARIDEGAEMSLKLQSDLSRLKEVEKQNLKLSEEVKLLKEGSENYLLLQEKYESSQTKLNRAEEKITTLQKLEVENETLKKKIKSWEVEDEGGSKVLRSPEALTKQISALQKSQISLKEEIGTLTASKATHENALQRLVERYRALKEENNVLKNKELKEEEETRKIKRRLFLAIADRDFVRHVLDQEIVDQNSSQLADRMEEVNQRTAKYQNEIDKLEKSAEEYRQGLEQCRVKNQELETELEIALIKLSVKDKRGVCQGDADQEKRFNELEKENSELEKKVLLLEAELETKQIKGCFDPSKTKVVHMAMNPFSKIKQAREEEYRKLKIENEKLKAALASAQGGTVSADTSIATASYTSAEAKELNAQLESAHLKYKRLHEVFEDRIKQFREACYQLFGYRIDVKGSSKYQLFPMYADSSNDFFIFQYNDGELQMVETEFSKTCHEAVEMFLYCGNSIPAFLSSVTTKLFANQTVIRDTTLAKV